MSIHYYVIQLQCWSSRNAVFDLCKPLTRRNCNCNIWETPSPILPRPAAGHTMQSLPVLQQVRLPLERPAMPTAQVFIPTCAGCGPTCLFLFCLLFWITNRCEPVGLTSHHVRCQQRAGRREASGRRDAPRRLQGPLETRGSSRRRDGMSTLTSFLLSPMPSAFQVRPFALSDPCIGFSTSRLISATRWRARARAHTSPETPALAY